MRCYCYDWDNLCHFHVYRKKSASRVFCTPYVHRVIATSSPHTVNFYPTRWWSVTVWSFCHRKRPVGVRSVAAAAITIACPRTGASTRSLHFPPLTISGTKRSCRWSVWVEICDVYLMPLPFDYTRRFDMVSQGACKVHDSFQAGHWMHEKRTIAQITTHHVHYEAGEQYTWHLTRHTYRLLTI